MRRAVIDIGTNTVKLLVADVDGERVTVLINEDTTTRLGEGLTRTGHLNPQAIRRTLDAVEHYRQLAAQHGAERIRVLATCAAREAANDTDLVRAVKDRCGLVVEVIGGETEAELIWRGVHSDPQFRDVRGPVLDVGGGSSEMILPPYRVSLPLGAVRLTERYGEDVATLTHHIRELLAQHAAPFRAVDGIAIGTGGSVVTLARLEHAEVHGAILTASQVRALVMKLHAIPLPQRRTYPRLPPERADIIVAGGLIVLLMMEAVGAHRLLVSTRNLRFGALWD
ncbi:MAG: Ppx/GppA family phosphatase [Verrucomicrobiae bacterium]|nr:Ppx/GppA family phosphatase [Verrucomicrobiae bacterium]MDW8343305.1 Ppx/GppA family phosphatase [Verrucomicrobiae bacterium]